MSASLDRAQSAAARGLMALPDRPLQLLAGRPVEREGQRLHPEAQLTLRLLALSGAPELTDLTPDQARARVAQDVRRVTGPPLAGVTVTDMTVEGATGPLRARLYVPERAPGGDGLMVYFHGGGFVTGDLDTHDNACRFLARQSGVRVLAIDYRRGPEHRFPSAIDDALAAFRYATDQAERLGADPARIAVGGDSAGGNLAAGIALFADPRPVFQLLVYPWLDLATKHESYVQYGDGFYLTESDLDWYRGHYLDDPADARDPRCSPLLAGDLAGAAPAYIATAGFDPLRDEAEAYAHRLQSAGVPVALRRHEGLLHGFFNTVTLGHAGREAVLEAAGALRLALAAPANGRRP